MHPLDNKIGLMVKINSATPLINLLGQTGAMQEKMERLKLLIENYIEDRNGFPDALYNFMDKVLEDK